MELTKEHRQVLIDKLPLYSDDKDHNLKEFYQHLKKLVKDYEDQTGEKVSEIVLSGDNNNYFSFTSK